VVGAAFNLVDPCIWADITTARAALAVRDARNIERASRDCEGIELDTFLHPKDFEPRVKWRKSENQSVDRRFVPVQAISRSFARSCRQSLHQPGSKRANRGAAPKLRNHLHHCGGGLSGDTYVSLSSLLPSMRRHGQ